MACAGAAAGVLLTAARQSARVVIPFSGGILLGVSLFSLLPELAADIGWGPGLALCALGYLALFLVDRFIYPVCPTCSHDHDHTGCATELHGFAAPLISATALHSFLDGWNISAAQSGGGADLSITVPMAILIHKAPEGVALGALMLAALGSRRGALGWSVAAEAVTLLGSGLALAIAPVVGVRWMEYPLGVAGGFFLYLGLHAVHEEWRRRGAPTALTSAAAGIVIAAAIQRAVHGFLH